jgi:hypothetical protein
MTHVRGLLGRGVGWCALFFFGCALAAALCFVTVGAAAAEAGEALQQTNLMLRLRSFAAGASARLEIEPSAAGGRARLTASSLPPPSAVAPRARVYLVWATGGRILRLGELRRDARGNAALEFAHPSAFERYSLIVTAEESARVDHPGGAPVFSTHAGEVEPVFPPPVAVRPSRTPASAPARLPPPAPA